MKNNTNYVECTDCGRKILGCNAYYLNGKPYGYSCYKKQLALLYKQWEDEKNAEYSAECFAAMQIFEGKKSNSFHDSICRQWNACRKLTAKQLRCITDGFTSEEKIRFWVIWQQLTNDVCLRNGMASWVETEMKKTYSVSKYINDESVINCLLFDREYKYGFHFVHDIDDDPEIVYMIKNGRNNEYLNANISDEYTEVLKVVEGIQSVK